MTRTADVIFDGKVLQPSSPLDLEPNARYRITIQEAAEKAEGADAWETLEALAGTVDAPADWSAEHDHYLYGSAKRKK